MSNEKDVSSEELSLEELIMDETSKRLNEMGKPDYEFPAKIGRSDVIAMLVGGGISVVLIILCMIGVIV